MSALPLAAPTPFHTSLSDTPSSSTLTFLLALCLHSLVQVGGSRSIQDHTPFVSILSILSERHPVLQALSLSLPLPPHPTSESAGDSPIAQSRQQVGVDLGECVCNSVRVFVNVEKKRRAGGGGGREHQHSPPVPVAPFLMEQALTSPLLNGPFCGTSSPVKSVAATAASLHKLLHAGF